ncbi:MAG: hypothetical protein IPF60_17925 [Betaproteobacteria bacterium]|nr:hypothetical protein [Betaproteobacteria bacterium]
MDGPTIQWRQCSSTTSKAASPADWNDLKSETVAFVEHTGLDAAIDALRAAHRRCVGHPRRCRRPLR